MLRLRFFRDAQPRAKNGQPAHSTTGVASTSCAQLDSRCPSSMCRSVRWPLISSRKTGTVSASPIQNRRDMSASSGSGPTAAVASSGSRAMLQIGQVPEPTFRTSGCIGPVLSALRPVDVAVDGLVADRRPAARRLPLQPPGDLLRRPAVPEPPDHVRPQVIVRGPLPTSLPASARQVLGVQGEVAAEPAIPVAEAVPAQLPIDGGRVPAEPLGDLADRPAGFHEAEEGASCVEVELAVGPGQKRLRGANPCKS